MNCFEKLLLAVRENKSVDVLTLVSAPADKKNCVGQMLCLQDGEITGFLVDSAFSKRVVNKIQDIVWRKPEVFEIDYNGLYRIFWDRWQGKRNALVLGGGHISQSLASMLRLVDFQVTVVDDRPEFANKARFPQAAAVICDSFTNALRGLNVAVFSAIIIVTRGHQHDLDCLRALVNSPVAYLGMIGSQRRVRSIIRLLREEGIGAEQLERLRAPIGLDIGAQTPAEIAVSITAEIVAAHRGGSCLPLSRRQQGI